MAKLHPQPYPGFNRNPGESFEQHHTRTGKILEELTRASFKKARSKETNGILLRFSVADGYAFYVVISAMPLTVQHVPFGDGYRISDAHIRGLKHSDVVAQMSLQAVGNRESDARESFINNLKKGDNIHWHNAFGQFVRYQVVRKTATSTIVKPVALVGKWDQRDIGYRIRTGEIVRGYYARQIIAGKQEDAKNLPHLTCLYESSSYVRPHKSHDIDPRKLAPISLEVPEMTVAEKEAARLWEAVSRVSALVQGHVDDPSEILRGVRGIVNSALTEVK